MQENTTQEQAGAPVIAPQYVQTTTQPPYVGKSQDTYSYRGWLVSDHFFKRMLAVVGYMYLFQLIIVGIFMFLGVVLLGSLIGEFGNGLN